MIVCGPTATPNLAFMSLEKPLVNICMSTYQHEDFIAKAIEGVLMQRTNFRYVLIIGEDHSSDNTRKICEQYQQKHSDSIKLLDSDKNYGQCENLARTLLSCDARYIALCEGDDYWTDPYKLQKQVDFLEKHTDYVLCFHEADTVDENEHFLERATELTTIKTYQNEELLHISYATMSLLFRNCIKQFPTEFFKVKSTDAFLFAMLASYGKGANLGFAGACYRKHSGGCYNNMAIVNRYKQSLHTRKLMKQAGCFNDVQKKHIQQEYLHRKLLYSKIFLKKMQLYNCLQMMIA